MTNARGRRAAHPAVMAVIVSLTLAACSTPASGRFALPPVDSALDYQLGGAYPAPEGVAVVARDRTAAPAVDLYSICYVNAFQTQPGESDEWPDVALLQRHGEPVIDPDWPDEIIVDTSTGAGRAAVIDTVAPWIRQCADDGFDAVEFDNLDTFTRTDGALTLDDNLAVARELVAVAHDAGLAAGQKNAAEFARELRDEAGFGCTVAEECAAFGECPAYTDADGHHVFDIEYDDNLSETFTALCADPTTPASVILRDRALATPDGTGYVYEGCRR